MSKQITLICLVLFLLGAVWLLPQEEPQQAVRPVEHQHRTWPRETEACTGLDAAGNLTTHLPILVLHTQGAAIPGAEPEDTAELTCGYSLIHNPGGVNSTGDIPALEGSTRISIRGNSSSGYAK